MKLIKQYKNIILAFILFLLLCFVIYLISRLHPLYDVNLDAKVYSGKAMNTVVKKTLYVESDERGEEIDKKIDKLLQDVENDLSVRISHSEIARCNKDYIKDSLYNLPKEILNYLKKEVQICKETNGAFSPCIRPISDLWGIEDGNMEIPDEKDITETLKNTNPMHLELKEKGIIFHHNDMAIDFGAVGKGIACDKLFELFDKESLHGAVISIGGNIAVYGKKESGNDWHIGIQDPRGSMDEYVGVLDVSNNKVISTSGDYQKFFETDGKRYHHIFDPATGYPADSDLISVTIISDSGFMADALSTTCFVLGLENGMNYAYKKDVEAIFITKDKKVYITNGIKKDFRLQKDDYSLDKYESKH